jgi:DNA-binding SARP family transcriptional activator
LPRGKHLALLTYLALLPERTTTREHLIDLLWSDLEPNAARHAFRQAVWHVRQRVGASALAARGGHHLSLGDHISSDHEDFVAAVQSGALEKALTLYRGEFIPDFSSGCD